MNMELTNFSYALATGIVVGVVSGYLGAFMVLRRMALVGDALSHVALPGVALAYAWNFNPFIGAFAALAIGIVFIWFIEYKTSISTEALVGLIFTLALAIGLLITPEENIFDALIGDISLVGAGDAIAGIVLSVVVLIAMRKLRPKFMLSAISPDLAHSSRISVAGVNLAFLFLIAIIVALGIKIVGTLLMGALIIIPAIASKNIASNLAHYTNLSMFFGLVSVGAGIILSNALSLPAGPIVVLSSGAIFGISFIFRKKH